MSYRGKFLVGIISAAIAVYAVVGGLMGAWQTRAQQPINDAGAQIRIFESVLQHIQNDYVDEPNLEKVRAGALRGLANGLDPYSSYLTADQVKDFQAKKQNTLAGIGAEFSQVSGYLYVVSVIKDSPSDKAGLKAGDVIEYIENKATRDISLYDARQLLLGEAGSKINLRVLRTGEKPQTITVLRGVYKIPIAEAKLEDGKIGVIKVYSLENGEAKDIRGRVQELTKQGAQKIILDLRGVAAGDLNDAVEVAKVLRDFAKTNVNLIVKGGVLGTKILDAAQASALADMPPRKQASSGGDRRTLGSPAVGYGQPARSPSARYRLRDRSVGRQARRCLATSQTFWGVVWRPCVIAATIS